MSTQFIKVMLRASNKSGARIAHDEFLGKLDYEIGRDVVMVEKSKQAWQTALVILAEIDTASLADSDEPSEQFESETSTQLQRASSWLASQPVPVFEECRDDGLSVDIFVNAWIDVDQFDLELPPQFLLACGERKLKIAICTND